MTKAFHDISMDELLPQQPPFRFVDHLEDYHDDNTCVSFTPKEGGLMMDGDCFSAAGLIEHMAQASAVRNGYVAKYILHIPVAIGFIGQVRKYRIFRLPRAGERLDTRVELKQEVFGVTLTDIEVKCGDEVICRASLKLALKND